MRSLVRIQYRPPLSLLAIILALSACDAGLLPTADVTSATCATWASSDPVVRERIVTQLFASEPFLRTAAIEHEQLPDDVTDAALLAVVGSSISEVCRAGPEQQRVLDVVKGLYP